MFHMTWNALTVLGKPATSIKLVYCWFVLAKLAFGDLWKKIAREFKKSKKTLDKYKLSCIIQVEFTHLKGIIMNIIAQLEAAVKEVIVVPNHWLPVEMWDNVRGGRTIERLEKILDKRDGLTAHRKLKATKARNIEKLAAQVSEKGEIDGPLDYSQNEVDEIAQYRAECALVGGMVSGGLIDADDLLED